MKKIVKTLVITLLVFVIVLVAVPYLFKDKIKSAVLTAVNDNLTAKVTFEDVNLSLLRNFPKASLALEDLAIVNNAPFENDTLFFVKELNLKMSIKELFKGENETVQISSIAINEAFINIVSNKDGVVNYDIVKPSSDDVSDSEGSAFQLSLNSYEINNSVIKYSDEAANIFVELNEFNHSGSGDLSAEESKLDTKSSTKLSVDYENVRYFDHNELTLDALIGINLKTNTYSFLQNEANISGLPLTFDGNVVLLDDGQQIDINFKTPTSSFKNFLAIMPKAYTSNLDDVETAGDFTVSGTVEGLNNDERIPNFDINIASNNASFKYPDLPKSVENITIKALIKNETGIIENTYVNLDALNFKIDQDVFKSSATIKKLTQNPLVNAKLNGTINLANIANAYPLEMEEDLSGILNMDITTNFDLEAVENNNYERIKTNGTITLSDFVYNGTALLNPFNIKTASVNFTPTVISLQQFEATTGNTDLKATGTLQDVIGFVVSNKDLKGNFNLVSNTFSLNDFMSDTVATEEEDDATVIEEEPAIKVPSFLDCTITAEAKNVIYDDLELTNLKGKMIIKDEKVTLENMTSSLLGGNIVLKGVVSTNEITPTFNMDLAMNLLNISESFEKLDLLKVLIPFASFIEGKLNTNLNFSGNLNNEFTPDLNTISGNAFAELLAKNIDVESSVLMNTLASQLQFIDLNKLSLNDIKTNLEFENGKVIINPFTINYQDINIEINGAHGFDNSMDYNATFMVPAKYLGTEITGLMSKYSEEDVSKIEVPITAVIGGDFSNPTVTTDYKSAVSNLATQLVDVDGLKNKGTSLINNLIKQQTTSKSDTTSTSTDKETTTKATQQKAVDSVLKNKLNGLFSKKEKDTVD